MRITARVISAGDFWTFDLKTPKIDDIFPMRPDGKREAKMDAVRTALNVPDCITHAKRDTSYLQCIAAQFVCKLGEWKDTNAIERGSEKHDRAVHRLEKQSEMAEGCEDESMYTTSARAEFTVRWREDGSQVVRFDVSTMDKSKRKQKKPWHVYLARLMTEAAKIVSEECVDCGYPPIEFTEDAERMYTDLLEWRKRDKESRIVAWGNERRLMCKCRCASGYCSPCHPKCRFYERGMCVEIRGTEAAHDRTEVA